MKRMNNNTATHTYNWPVVGGLLFLTGIAGIPAIFIVALVAMGPDTMGSASAFINQAHFNTPLAVIVHGGSGIVFFLTMPFQFSSKLRIKFPRYHRTLGKFAIASAYTMALSGIWMHNVLSPESQGARYFVLIITSLLICISFSIALGYVLKRNITEHKRWMARAVAITLAAVTPLFLDIVIYLLFTNFPEILTILTTFQYDYGRLVGIGMNLFIVELIWRKGVNMDVKKAQYHHCA